MSAVINRRDLDFQLNEWLGLPTLLERERYASHDPESVSAMLDLAQQLAQDELAPHLRASDVTEPRLTVDGKVEVLPQIASAVRLMGQSGLFSSPFDEAVGGLQLPDTVHMAAMGLLMSGCLSTASFMLLTVANARVIAAFGNPQQVEQFAKPQIAGDALGTMCLSEPHAGSSLGDILTRAMPDGEDELGARYRIRGSKMWISGGDNEVTDNIIHLVLAKAVDEQGKTVEGSRGISLFIVPKYLPNGERNDLVVSGLNHKMGYRGLPNCALNFGEGWTKPEGAAGAIGWRVGELGRGLAQMFQMMNEARTSVGLAGAMLSYRAYLMALDYARSRTQGRLPGVNGGEQTPIINHADVKRMLLAQKSYAEGALGLVLYSARLIDEGATAPSTEERELCERLLALLTPITKTWPSEWGQESLNMAIQIHGGAGYTRDFEVEQLYRDNRLNPIHEGTTGIQGIDLVNRKIRRDNGAAFAELRAKVDATLRRAADIGGLDAERAAVEAAWNRVGVATETLLAAPGDAEALVHATAFLSAMGHAVLGWIWLEQALPCQAALAGSLDEAERAFRQGKVRACRYFCLCELPKVDGWLAPLIAGVDVLTSMGSAEFA